MKLNSLKMNNKHVLSHLLFFLGRPTLFWKAFKVTHKINKIQLDEINYFLIECILVLSRFEIPRVDTYKISSTQKYANKWS